MSLWRKPPARRRKKIFLTTAAGKTSLAPAVLDATMSARAISAAILFLVALAALELAFGEAFYIYHPVVTGNQRVPADEIVAASQIETLHVVWLEPERAARTLVNNMPGLRAAFIWCGLPAECVIQVLEREPAFEWRQGQTRTWVDAEGMAFPARGQTPDIPIVEAASSVPALLPGHQVDHALVSTLLELVRVLPEVKSFRYTTERGVEFNDPQGNWPVYVGVGRSQPGEMAARVTMWKAVAANLALRNVRPKFVDVRYPQAPYYGK
jgi:cell division septal protein FtsQ